MLRFVSRTGGINLANFTRKNHPELKALSGLWVISAGKPSCGVLDESDTRDTSNYI